VCVRGWVGVGGRVVGGGGYSPTHIDPPINVLFAINASLRPTCVFSCFVTPELEYPYALKKR
jgi:hypothetical protein